MARRAYVFLLRPTSGQVQRAFACIEDHRILYNAALEERRTAYRKAGVTIRYGQQSGQLKEIRRADLQGQGRWSFSSQQATLRRLSKAFDGFFRRVKAGQAPGYPRFKGRGRFDSVQWPKDGDGCRWNCTPDSDHVRVYLQGIGHVKVRAHRKVEGRVKTITLKRAGKRLYVVLSCDDVPALTLPQTGSKAGIDMGVVSFLTTSDGRHEPNPRFVQTMAGELAAAQQALSRKTRGSHNRAKARAKVAAIHTKIRRQRADFHHKSALTLVRAHDVIAHEKLRIDNMTRSASGTVTEPGTNVAQKSGLNKSILDAGWAAFLRILTAKAESAGRTTIAVDAAHTSQTCPECGHAAKQNRRTQAEFACQGCGYTDHADIVGAINVLRRGLASQPEPVKV
ncbi:transposase [Actinoplanes sp. NBC_00393]|uniref:RNA-guided endonuclease InsQ/TnpB family protein n=1 Tax=Actinoplanes sp. NBC_00393 TaxID=2975953 RepID=UPI002E224E31